MTTLGYKCWKNAQEFSVSCSFWREIGNFDIIRRRFQSENVSDFSVYTKPEKFKNEGTNLFVFDESSAREIT